MNLDIQSLKVFVSPQELTYSILQKRLAKLSAKKPRLRIVFLHPMISFFWLFCVFATFLSAFLSLSFVGRIAIGTIYQLLPLFLGGALGIPLISSVLSLQQRQKRHRAELAFCRRKPITEVEVIEYFEECKSSFILQYQESVTYLKGRLNYASQNTIEKQQIFSPDIIKVQHKVTDVLELLEQLKDNYLSRLESLEKNFIQQIKRGKEELFIESVAEFELVLEHFNREIDRANTYLEAAREVDGSMKT